MAHTPIVHRLLVPLLFSQQLTILNFEIRNKFGVSCVRFLGMAFKIPHFFLQLCDYLSQLLVPDSAVLHLPSQLSVVVGLGRYVSVIILSYNWILIREMNCHIYRGTNI